MWGIIDICLEILVVLAGAAAIGYAGWNAWRFARIPRRLSRAFSLNLAGEFVAGVATLFFGVSQTFRWLPDFTDIEQNLIRLAMLLFLLVPSHRLRRVVWEIEHGGRDE